MIRIVKIGLIITVVLWGLLGALGNVLNWGARNRWAWCCLPPFDMRA